MGNIITPSQLKWHPHLAGTKIHLLNDHTTIIRYSMEEYEVWDKLAGNEPVKLNYKQLTEYLNEE